MIAVNTVDDRPLPPKPPFIVLWAKGDELYARDTEQGVTYRIPGQFFAFDSERMDQYARLARGEPSSMSDYFQGFVADKPHPLMSATGSEGRCELCGLRESRLHEIGEVIAQISRLVNGAGEWITVTPELLRDWMARLSTPLAEVECVAQVFGGKIHWVTAAPVLADGTKLYAFKHLKPE